MLWFGNTGKRAAWRKGWRVPAGFLLHPSSRNLSDTTLLNKHREKGKQAAPRAIVTLSEGAKHQRLVRMQKGEFGGDANKDKQEKE